MRELRRGLKSPAVKRWQDFLKGFTPPGHTEPFYRGASSEAADSADHPVFDRNLERATRNFQKWLLRQAKPQANGGIQAQVRIPANLGRTYQVRANGRVDTATTLAAQELKRLHPEMSVPAYEPEPEFKIGPDIDSSDASYNPLLETRPYFLIPLPEPPEIPADQSAARAEVRRRILAWIDKVYPASNEPRVTDIYVFSHGWHRNFYQAVSAYDRLSSRIARLIRSGRFDNPSNKPTDEFKPSEFKNFRPLFLNFHWHSDPGEDDFEDKSGRRDKSSFMQKIALVFEPKDKSDDASIQMTKDFEDIFALFSRMAAPDTKALSDEDIKTSSQDLFKHLDKYQLKDIPDAKGVPHSQERNNTPEPSPAVAANRPTKTALAWTCYHEADIRQVLLDNDENPAAFISPQNAFATFARFTFGLAGVALAGTVIGSVSKWLQWPPLLKWLQLIPSPYALWAKALVTAVLVLFFVLITCIMYREREVPGRLDMSEAGEQDEETRKEYVTRRLRQLWAIGIFPFLSVVSLACIKAATLLPRKVENRLVFDYDFWQKYRMVSFGRADLCHYVLKAYNLLDYSLLLTGVISFFALLCWGALIGLGRLRKKKPNASGRTLLNLPLLIWLPFQIVVALPIASYLLFTYFFGRWTAKIGWIANLYPERLSLNTSAEVPGNARDASQPPRSGQDEDAAKAQGKAHDTAMQISDYRDRLAIAARLPIQLVKNALAKDNSAIASLDTADGLLAFYEMQRKGVEAGKAAGDFLCELLKAKELQNDQGSLHPEMRIHLIGHSFGALVVANMAQYLASKPQPGSPQQIQTLCLLEGAIASNWFTKARSLEPFVSGTIANIYSRYDTANGFYYPVANNGRMAAGYVGLIGTQKKEHFVLLVEPPDFHAAQYSPDQKTPKSPLPKKLNLDASRIIYQGPPASGGGHTDVYKDDVIHLVWAATRTAPK